MLNKKEIIIISVVIIVLALGISLMESIELFLYALLSVFLIIGINITAKKIMAYRLDSEIEIKLWEIKQYGFRPKQHFKKPFPIGLILPLISKVIFFPINGLIWMASLIFDIKPKIYRAAKRHGFYSFSEVTETHIGLIATTGVIANLIIAIIAYFIGFQEFSKLSVFYIFFNMLPISNLDGNKIFFGNIVLWSFLASIVLIGMLLTLFII